MKKIQLNPALINERGTLHRTGSVASLYLPGFVFPPTAYPAVRVAAVTQPRPPWPPPASAGAGGHRGRPGAPGTPAGATTTPARGR